jgi:hypothetical protein
MTYKHNSGSLTGNGRERNPQIAAISDGYPVVTQRPTTGRLPFLPIHNPSEATPVPAGLALARTVAAVG